MKLSPIALGAARTDRLSRVDTTTRQLCCPPLSTLAYCFNPQAHQTSASGSAGEAWRLALHKEGGRGASVPRSLHKPLHLLELNPLLNWDMQMTMQSWEQAMQLAKAAAPAAGDSTTAAGTCTPPASPTPSDQPASPASSSNPREHRISRCQTLGRAVASLRQTMAGLEMEWYAFHLHLQGPAAAEHQHQLRQQRRRQAAKARCDPDSLQHDAGLGFHQQLRSQEEPPAAGGR